MTNFDSVSDYYSSLPDEQRDHISALVDWVFEQYPQFEVVIAWNQPMFKFENKYIIGFMPTKKHTNLLTVSDTAITALEPELSGYKHGTRSISLPFDWKSDVNLLKKVVTLRLQELGLSF